MPSLSLCTWNVNGARKLRRFFARSRETVRDPDVLCLQETWATTDAKQLSIQNYVAFHAEAQPSQGHGVGGLSSFFRIEAFAKGRLVKLPSPVWWSLIVRWASDDDQGLIVVNIYAARFTSGVQSEDYELLFEAIDDIIASYGHDRLVIVGDFNADRFRRPNPTSREERMTLEWFRKMEAMDFRVLPDRPVVTYADASTTLDYILLSPALNSQPHSWDVEEELRCQHLPLRVVVNVDFSPSGDALVARPPNLRFPPDRVLAVQELLSLLLENLNVFPSPDLLYEMITFGRIPYPGKYTN